MADEPNLDPNQPCVIYGVTPAIDKAKADAIATAEANVTPIKGYTQTAMRTTTMTLLLGIEQEVLFTPAMLTKLEPGGTPEVTIDAAGRVTIPDTAVGRFTPQVTVTGQLALALTVRLAVYDSKGVVVGTYATTGYPARRTQNLVIGSETPFSGFRPIGHLAGTGLYTVRIYLTSTAGVGITTVELTLNKSG